MKTLNQIKNTFWGLEQEICWDWLYKQQEGNIYGKTSENFMYFNMFFLNFLFRIILFDRLCVTIDKWNILQMHLGIKVSYDTFRLLHYCLSFRTYFISYCFHCLSKQFLLLFGNSEQYYSLKYYEKSSRKISTLLWKRNVVFSYLFRFFLFLCWVRLPLTTTEDIGVFQFPIADQYGLMHTVILLFELMIVFYNLPISKFIMFFSCTFTFSSLILTEKQ